MEKHERFQLFINNLKFSEPASSSEDAFDLLSNTLNKVEDECSSIPYAPTQWMIDGRMYPPQQDNKSSTDNPNIDRYRNKDHNTYIGSNGSIKIVNIRNKKIVINKIGKDERKVDDL